MKFKITLCLDELWLNKSCFKNVSRVAYWKLYYDNLEHEQIIDPLEDGS